MKDWHVGQQVVCVFDRWFETEPTIRYPVKGDVYTIAAIHACTCGCGNVGLRLVEVSRLSDGFRPDFFDRAFRPVRDTSIESLRSLLNPSPTKVSEDA